MITTRIATTADITGMLALQKKNLYGNLNEKERSKGFVTTPFTTSQIEAIIKQNGLFVATNKAQQIIAYAFAGSWKYFEQWDIFNFMVARFTALSFKKNKITTIWVVIFLALKSLSLIMIVLHLKILQEIIKQNGIIKLQ